MAKKRETEKKAAKKRKKVAPVPPGYGTVTAVLNQADAKATIAFCKAAFGAKLRAKTEGGNGMVMHAELQIGDSLVMLSDAVMEPASAGLLFLYVPDVDKVFAKAVKAGAKPLMPPADQFWGDRFARVEDPFGNRWGIATHVEDVEKAELKKRMKAMEKRMAAQQG